MARKIIDLPLDDVILGNNDRSQYTGIEELAEGIDQTGSCPPISVRPLLAGKYEIIAGHRRYFAHKHLKRETIEAIVEDGAATDDEKAFDIMWLENHARVDINPIDQANSIKKRMDLFGYSAEEVAERLRVAPMWVRNRLRLITLIPQAQHLIAVGQLKVGYGLTMCHLDSDRQKMALQALSRADLSLPKFRELVNKLTEAQAQESMFDMSQFMTAPIMPKVDQKKAALDRLLQTYPVNDDLPDVEIVRGSVTNTIAGYIDTLMEAGLDAEAAAVSTLYVRMVKAGLLKAKVES